MQQGQLTIRIVFSSPEGVKEALAKAETSGPFIAEKYGPFDDTTTIQGIMIGVLIVLISYFSSNGIISFSSGG